MAIIKCKECGHQVSDKAEKCPNCGCPVLSATNANKEETNVEPLPKKNDNDNWKKWDIIALLLCLIAGGGYYAFTLSNDSTDKNLSIDIKDSNTMNTEMEDSTADNNKTQVNAVISFIEDFYNNNNYGDYDFLREHCSAQVLQKLRDDYDAEFEEGSGYAIWDFRSGAQDGPNERHEIISVTPLEDDWYCYKFYDMGNKGSCTIKVENIDGAFMITGLKKGICEDTTDVFYSEEERGNVEDLQMQDRMQYEEENQPSEDFSETKQSDDDFIRPEGIYAVKDRVKTTYLKLDEDNKAYFRYDGKVLGKERHDKEYTYFGNWELEKGNIIINGDFENTNIFIYIYFPCYRLIEEMQEYTYLEIVTNKTTKKQEIHGSRCDSSLPVTKIQ